MAEETKGQPQTRGKEDDLQQRITNLEFQIAQARAGAPLGTLPWHSAGIEDEVAETWSLYDQELANSGEHPDQ
jgi:hypothetical protein